MLRLRGPRRLALGEKELVNRKLERMLVGKVSMEKSIESMMVTPDEKCQKLKADPENGLILKLNLKVTVRTVGSVGGRIADVESLWGWRRKAACWL